VLREPERAREARLARRSAERAWPEAGLIEAREWAERAWSEAGLIEAREWHPFWR